MRQSILAILLVPALVAGETPARHAAPSAPSILRFDPVAFKKPAHNLFFPTRSGTTYIYATKGWDGSNLDTVIVTRETKNILGVSAVAVIDREAHNSSLTEDTVDWYAGDASGNVWYLGEETRELRSGKVVSTAASWEAGKDQAHAGIIMEAIPMIGDKYREEYRPGVAEHMARVISLGEDVSTPHGAFNRCVEIEEWSPLEPNARERKYYAPNVGLVMRRNMASGGGETVLVKLIAR